MRKYSRMCFSEAVEKTEATAIHRFFFDISKDYIKGKNVLDVGCWTGGYEVFINNYARQITAIDIEERALKVAKKSFPGTKFLKASVLNLPFPNRSFDVVTLWAVIEHIPRGTETKALKEINRVLKQKGILCLNTMNDYWLSKLLDPAYFLKGHRHYKIEVLKGMLDKTGFKVLKIFVNGGLLTPIYLNAFYFFKYFLRRRMPRLKIIEDWQKKEYYKKGFNEVNIIARKK
jgi:ubiquinone/menaquinone biosynthesis C-methylase UbiE